MIQPMHDRVLVKHLPEKEELIALTDRDKAKICEVLAVGPGRWEDGVFTKTVVKPGDVVYLPGVANDQPDYVLEDGSFLIQQADIGAIVG